MLSIIQSFHEDMEAVVRVRDVVTDIFEVRNTLRQGHTMVSTLYFNAQVSVWRDQCDEVGIPVLYKHGRKVGGGSNCEVQAIESASK